MSLKNVVVHNNIKSLMMETNLRKSASSLRSVCKLLEETARIISECMRVVL